ncbi:histidinol-phosphate transaminase [Hydrogenophaga sp. PAMC20947]|uniref:histidinol-phosphate transaminase n=1 Tax=Hydrogenophaga sp. PAMC20947 TaxID=2565558 RepID=UPI00109E2C18|nr:histidinol-phosphate transaminase [Hydrogenophaga sp. PAMC20947]QCB45845.1 histidinol-phosphate transaminase [Hydrogenophaga sp. PAMC20947]
MTPSASDNQPHGLRFNPHVAALPPYHAGMNVAVARGISGQHDIARLASNENPEGCSPMVMTALASAAYEPWRYADPACTALRAALAQKLGCEARQLVIGNGSEELIAAIARAVLVPGSRVLTVVPSFGLHEIEPLAAGAEVVKVAMTPALGFDLDGLERELALAPHVAFLSSPWNPVGPALDSSALQRVIKAVKPGTLLVLDEAYFEFADPGAPDGIEVLRASGVSHVVLRTFSKAYGLAGLRVGYAVCSHPEIARVLSAAKTPFNVNAAAQAAALAALADEAWMHASVGRLRLERARVAQALCALGLRVAPSQTNFLFFDAGKDSGGVADTLLRQAGIIVKAWREPGYERFIRATIGSPAENDRLIAALAQIHQADPVAA